MSKHRSAFLCILLLDTAALWCTGCKDEYSFEGVAADDSVGNAVIDSLYTAQFTVIGDPDTCLGATVTGSYQVDVPLTAANTITLQVNVAKAGPYVLTTDTLNGIHFNAAGRFDSTGKQAIVLEGTGTPTVPSTLFFTPLGTHCTLRIAVLGSAGPATYLLIAEPNTLCVNTTVAGNYKAGASLTASNTVTIVVDARVIGSFSIATTEVNGIAFSRSGVFTKTGYQYIVLNGRGTATSSGTYTFTPQIVGPHPLGGESCTFYVDVQ